MSSPAAHVLGELSYPQVEAILRLSRPKIALLPVGSTEAHGPHLPLNTDSLICEAMAVRAADKLAHAGYEAVRFPTLHYAVTDWAAAFKGSSTLDRGTDEAVISELARAALGMGFDRVVLCNAHLEPGNISALRAVTRRFEEEEGGRLLFPDKTRRRFVERLTDEFKSGSCHAGQYETSIVLAISPELVDMSIAATLPDHYVPMHERIAGGARDFVECGMDRAYCGNPAGATAEEGRRSLETLAEIVLEVVRDSLTADTR